MIDTTASRAGNERTEDKLMAWLRTRSRRPVGPYQGMATAVYREHGPAGLDEEDALAVFHAQLTIMSRYSFNPRQLEPWDIYANLLEEYVEQEQKDDLRVLWDYAHREVLKQDEPPSQHYRPAVPTTLCELQAETVVEFIALLRTLITRSGVSTNQVAGRAPSTGPARLNASQLYAVLSRGTLPRSAAQICSFGEAVGLDEFQTQQLLRVWAALRHAQRAPRQFRSAVPAPGALALRHRPRHHRLHADDQPGHQREDVQQWLARAERTRRNQPQWAPQEPTTAQATREAAAMTAHLRGVFAASTF